MIKKKTIILYRQFVFRKDHNTLEKKKQHDIELDIKKTRTSQPALKNIMDKQLTT